MLISSLNHANYLSPLNSTFGSGSSNGNANDGALSLLDQASLSNEAQGEDGNLNPALLQMIYETKLQSGLQEVEQARAGGSEDDATRALETLGAVYGDAKQKQVPLSQELESAVRQALGIQGGENGAGGDQGNLDALNQGGFNADDGGSGGVGGGGGGGGGSGGGGCGGCVGGGGAEVGPPPRHTEEDKQFLNQAITQDSESFGDLVTGWRQGAEGNCSTVAAIKAAMDRYDNKVFDEVTRTDNGYDIVMQDGYKMNLSDGELGAAKAASNFKGPDGPAKSYANFLYGATAKRNGLDNGMTLSQSFRDLNSGESIYSPAKSLGLQHQMVRVDPRTLNGQDSVVAGSHRHAVFVNRNANGTHTSDRWGRAANFNGTDNMGNRLINAYTFRPRSVSSGRSGAGGSLAGGPRSVAPKPPAKVSRPTTVSRPAVSKAKAS